MKHIKISACFLGNDGNETHEMPVLGSDLVQLTKAVRTLASEIRG